MKRSTPFTLVVQGLVFALGFATRAYTAEKHPELLAAGPQSLAEGCP